MAQNRNRNYLRYLKSTMTSVEEQMNDAKEVSLKKNVTGVDI